MLKEDRISGSQAFNLLVITVMGTEILIFPSFAARGAGVDAWLVPAVALVGALLVVLAQIRLAANFPGQTVAQYSRLVLGNLPGRLVSLAYAWFFLHLAALVLRRFGGLMETVFLREPPLVVILLVMGILAVSAVRNGLGCLARVNELIAAIVVAAVLILLNLIAKELDISSLQPVLAAGFLPLLRSAAVPIAWYGEVVVLLYIIPHLQKPERGTTIVLAVLLVSAAFFTISTMASIMLFGPDGTARMAFPFVSLARMVRIAFFERLEAVIMGIWVGGIFVKIALFLWCCVVSLGQAFNLQEYRPLIPPLGVLLVILALLSGESLLELNDFLLHSFPLYGLLFEFFLPLFLLLAANIRARLDPAFPKKP